MDNKDRENLISFLGKFQGGGEPSKDIFSRYPDDDLKNDILDPLIKLASEIEEYLVFDTDVYKPNDMDVENSIPILQKISHAVFVWKIIHSGKFHASFAGKFLR